MNGLLDLCDDQLQGRAMPQKGVLTYDDPDSFLRIDGSNLGDQLDNLPNEISQRRQFWMSDAVAPCADSSSGLGVPAAQAQVAWECARFHLAELGLDIDNDTVRVVLVGSLRDELIANFLLLSRRLSVVGVVDSGSILIDPSPDLARAYAERESLIHQGELDWSHYDVQALSENGVLISRGEEEVELSPELCDFLQLEERSATPAELGRRVLGLECDLLLISANGVFVKASHEKHGTIGDVVNDELRIDAETLNCRAIVEARGSGVTPAARVEFASSGGAINTGAIDGRAELEMRDYESNLKLALGAPVATGQLKLADRDHLLRDLGPEILGRVKRNTRRRLQSLWLEQQRSRSRGAGFEELILDLSGKESREAIGLAQVASISIASGKSLNRPELSSLIAIVKEQLRRELLLSTLVEEGFFESYLRNYFPDSINGRFGHDVRSHRLRREIIAKQIADAMVDTMGATFLWRSQRVTNSDVISVVRAWAVASAIANADRVLDEIYDSDPRLPRDAQLACSARIVSGVEQATRWILKREPIGPTGELVEMLSVPMQDLFAMFPEALPDKVQQAFQQAIGELAVLGVHRELAQRVIQRAWLPELLDIRDIASEIDVSHQMAAEAFHRVDEIVDLRWLASALSHVNIDDHWHRLSADLMREALSVAKRNMAHSILFDSMNPGNVEERISDFLDANYEKVAVLNSYVDELKGSGGVSLVSLNVVVRELDELLERRR